MSFPKLFFNFIAFYFNVMIDACVVSFGLEVIERVMYTNVELENDFQCDATS